MFFSQLLIPNKVEPAHIRQAELTSIILLLVASDRGVTVLPDWVVAEIINNSDYAVTSVKKTEYSVAFLQPREQIV